MTLPGAPVTLEGGRVKALVATNALELGVDIGDLDVTLHLGFNVGARHPSTTLTAAGDGILVATAGGECTPHAPEVTVVQGRAGRREQPSLCFIVAFPGNLDQYYMNVGCWCSSGS